MDTKIQSKGRRFAFWLFCIKIEDLLKMEITNYITTDFKAIDSQELLRLLKTFWWFDFFHTFLLLKKAFTL
jgi:hypothetical protein